MKLSDELASIDTLRNDFVNEFSHEFKTPLSSITGFSQLLLEGGCTPEETKRYLTIIAQESERLLALTESQLLLSKLDSQQIVVEKKTYLLDEQIRQCIILLSPEWTRKELDFSVELTPIPYYGNADLLQHVWINLISIYFSKIYEKDAWKIIPGMLASSLSWGLSITVHSFILGHLGTDAAAAYSVTGVAQQLIQCLTQGLSSGASIMISQLLGRNLLNQAKEYGNRFWRVALWCGLINVGLICIVGPLVYIFYVLEPKAKEYLIQMLIFSALYMFAYAYNTIFTCGVFPAGGDSRYDAVSVFFATWCFAIPLSLLGCFVFHWPVIPVYVVMCLDEIVKLPFLSRHYKKFLWLKNLTRDQSA